MAFRQHMYKHRITERYQCNCCLGLEAGYGITIISKGKLQSPVVANQMKSKMGACFHSYNLEYTTTNRWNSKLSSRLSHFQIWTFTQLGGNSKIVLRPIYARQGKLQKYKGSKTLFCLMKLQPLISWVMQLNPTHITWLLGIWEVGRLK